LGLCGAQLGANIVSGTVNETLSISVFDGLHAVIERGHIGKFLEDLARPFVVTDSLSAAYAEMSDDKARDAEASSPLTRSRTTGPFKLLGGSADERPGTGCSGGKSMYPTCSFACWAWWVSPSRSMSRARSCIEKLSQQYTSSHRRLATVREAAVGRKVIG
jgi:hypothetical protein